MDVRPDMIAAVVGGSGVTAFLAKYVVGKALRDLDGLSKKVEAIDKQLVAITVRLEKILEHDTSIKELQKKLVR